MVQIYKLVSKLVLSNQCKGPFKIWGTIIYNLVYLCNLIISRECNKLLREINTTSIYLLDFFYVLLSYEVEKLKV